MRDPCLDKPRKPIIPIKTLDILFRRRRLPNTQFYFTNRKHALPTADEPKEVKVKSFRVPKPQKLLSYIRYSDRNEKLLARKRLYQPLHLKDNLKIAATRDLSRRLYIEPQPDDVKAVVDSIHPEFYTSIEGRPLRFFDDIKVYIENIRVYAMSRQQIGYRRDKLLKLNLDIVDEMKEYNQIAINLRQHINNFQKYLTEDYRIACGIIAKAEMVHNELHDKAVEYVGFVIEYTNMSNVVFKLDAIRTILKSYRVFLLFAAPLFWREVYDESFKVPSVQIEQGEFVTRSEEFIGADDDLLESTDIEHIVANAIVELRNPPPNYLFFETPADMIYLFRTMELQCRSYLFHLSNTQEPYLELLYCIKKLKESTKKEMSFSQFFIDGLEKEIEREAFNETYFQNKFMRILNETFYDTVASPDTLKLKICIEYVYEQIFGKCDEGHQNLREPMKILEGMYEEYSLRIDQLDFRVVTDATKELFQQDLKLMNSAYKAQRELKDFAMMTKAINKAFLPPAQYKRPAFKKFQDKNAIRAEKREAQKRARLARGDRIKPKPFKVLPKDREDLIFFTEWCDGMNPAPFLQDLETYVRPALENVEINSSDY